MLETFGTCVVCQFMSCCRGGEGRSGLFPQLNLMRSGNEYAVRIWYYSPVMSL